MKKDVIPMRVLESVKAACSSTEPTMRDKRKQLLGRTSKRMYIPEFEVVRLGQHRPCEPRRRSDMSQWAVLTSYLARRVYINEKFLRGEYLFTETYELEKEFTLKLWNIFTYEIFGKYLPELPFPDTYDGLEQLFLNTNVVLNKFNVTDVVLAADMHSSLVDEDHPNKFTEEDFNFICHLPSSLDRPWTKLFALRKAHDGRHESAQCLIHICIGLFIYAAKDAPAPYPNFWNEHAYNAMNKAIVRFQDSIIRKLKYARMYEVHNRYTDFPKANELKKLDWKIPNKNKKL